MRRLFLTYYPNKNPIDLCWRDRPKPCDEEIMLLEESFTGVSSRAKRDSAAKVIQERKADFALITQLDSIAKPFIFEPNDELTRNEIKQAVESFLLELVGQRALFDFLVVCDDTNNTPTRIDRNELYVDIAIEPVKSVEFIYIPLRIKNTGEIAKLGN